MKKSKFYNTDYCTPQLDANAILIDTNIDDRKLLLRVCTELKNCISKTVRQEEDKRLEDVILVCETMIVNTYVDESKDITEYDVSTFKRGLVGAINDSIWIIKDICKNIKWDNCNRHENSYEKFCAILSLLNGDIDSDLSTLNILMEDDSSCEMCCVSLEGETIMEGNYWDFHNGCHGLNKYLRFDTRRELVGCLKSYYQGMGFKVNSSNTTYDYESKY